MPSQTWLFALALLFAGLAVWLWRSRAARQREAETTWRLARVVARSGGASVSGRSASDLLALVRALSAQGGIWTEILATANPTSDPLLGQKLAQLRGPHQFVPHVALNVLEHGCELALARNPRASQMEAIDAALQSAAVVVRAGD